MLVSFTKMHGLGNDFVVLDERESSFRLSSAQLARIADRRFGVGCDQILVIAAPSIPGTIGRYEIFNADGSAAEHCGNGVRCVALYLKDAGAVMDDRLNLEINGAVYQLNFESDKQIRVDMGAPKFAPKNIPINVDSEQSRYDILVDGMKLSFGCVSIGNPHAVTIVDDVSTAEVAKIGAALQTHDAFPAKVNVGFMQIIDSSRIKLRVFERGVGETLACGTGACAAVAVGRAWGHLDSATRVELSGGTLHIEWSGERSDVIWMVGPAERVFEGTMEL
ncbi:MAG: diaminopimelate epimerase [Gammaproteobacteria bacterium]|jgi:diaminopimelate epimerase